MTDEPLLRHALNRVARFLVYAAVVFTVIASVLSIIGTGAWLYGAGVALGLWLASVVCCINDPATQDAARSMGLPL
jgi:hypothetical protein